MGPDRGLVEGAPTLVNRFKVEQSLTFMSTCSLSQVSVSFTFYDKFSHILHEIDATDFMSFPIASTRNLPIVDFFY